MSGLRIHTVPACAFTDIPRRSAWGRGSGALCMITPIASVCLAAGRSRLPSPGALISARPVEPWVYYSVDTPELYDAALARGAMLFTSNDPAWAMSYLRGKGLHG